MSRFEPEPRIFRPPRQFVTDDDVSKALAYLRKTEDGEDYEEAQARWQVTKAENELERIKGHVYLQKEGPAETRKAARDCDEAVCRARDALADAKRFLDEIKERVRWAETVWEIWRTQSSNARSAHSVR